MKQVKTTCPYCGVGCGVIASTDDQGKTSIKGDLDHPANYGKLCSKGSALGDTLDHNNRLLTPQKNGKPISWGRATKEIANKLNQTIEKYGPDSVAFYVSGQLLTEDYYVANKLMKGFIGSSNIDSNSRLCMSSAVAGHKRSFGEDIVAGNYQDWDQCDLAILAGSNAAWCHPILFNRLTENRKKRGAKIIVIDPKVTATAKLADLHLQIKPGSDVILWQGLFNYMLDHQATNQEFIKNHTDQLSSTILAAKKAAPTLEYIANATNLTIKEVEIFYRYFFEHEKTLSIFSQGVNQSSAGTDKVNAIINCHLLTGRIGKVGMGPFSITGQPNAMGGREVGGLANMLAAHMDFDKSSVKLVGEFWQAPNITQKPGLKAVDMFNAVADGKIKAIWIMATNPMVTMPNGNLIEQALKDCPLVIVSDCMNNTDTAEYADYLLPARTWGEKEGMVTNSERRVSRQRRFLDTAGSAKPDWWIISQVAQQMGFGEAFNYQTSHHIYQEFAALTAYKNEGAERRLLNLSGLENISKTQYDEWKPKQWPFKAETETNSLRLLSDKQFPTKSGRAQFVAIDFHPPQHQANEDYPLILNSGRIRDQWHTMTRTAKSERLNQQYAEPFIEISAKDAQKYNIRDYGFIAVECKWGKAIVRAHISDQMTIGNLFMPMHWTKQYASNAVIGKITNPATDPISGQPELKHTPVKIQPYVPQWHGYWISQKPLEIQLLKDDTTIKYWAYQAHKKAHLYQFAGDQNPTQSTFTQNLINHPKTISLEDEQNQHFRYAKSKDGKIADIFIYAKKGFLPDYEPMLEMIKQQSKIDEKNKHFLSGFDLSDAPSKGKLICACNGVYENELISYLENYPQSDLTALTSNTKAATNCGSCLSEVKAIFESKCAKPQHNHHRHLAMSQ